MNLEHAKSLALIKLSNAGEKRLDLKPTMNLRLWMGVGFCVAKGWATYHGDDEYKITPAGERELLELRRLDLLVLE